MAFFWNKNSIFFMMSLLFCEMCTVADGSCSDDQFQCHDDQCIPKSFLCDGDNHCSEGEDESGFSRCVKCEDDQFRCADGTECVSQRFICDGDNDCDDESDELGCSSASTTTAAVCQDDEFRCANGQKCIPRKFMCDGDDDCDDNSDEDGCDRSTCAPDKFQCSSDKRCIPESFKCDGDKDCNEAEDELGCGDCEHDKFRCADASTCIPKSYLCDNDNDCPDKSDEAKCRNSSETGTTTYAPTTTVLPTAAPIIFYKLKILNFQIYSEMPDDNNELKKVNVQQLGKTSSVFRNDGPSSLNKNYTADGSVWDRVNIDSMINGSHKIDLPIMDNILTNFTSSFVTSLKSVLEQSDDDDDDDDDESAFEGFKTNVEEQIRNSLISHYGNVYTAGLEFSSVVKYKEFLINQAIIVPPCSLVKVTSFVQSMEKVPFNYSIVFEVTGKHQGDDNFMPVDKIEESLEGFEIIGRKDDKTIIAKGESSLIVDHFWSPSWIVKGKPIEDCDLLQNQLANGIADAINEINGNVENQQNKCECDCNYQNDIKVMLENILA